MKNYDEETDELCGGRKKPTYPGSPNAGAWYCENQVDWVWVEEIGKRVSLKEAFENWKQEIKRLSK